jgi:hypothetical protein
MPIRRIVVQSYTTVTHKEFDYAQNQTSSKCPKCHHRDWSQRTPPQYLRKLQVVTLADKQKISKSPLKDLAQAKSKHKHLLELLDNIGLVVF